MLKLKAGILPLTIVISLIITVICASFILVLYFYNLQAIKYNKNTDLLNNLYSAREFTLSVGETYFGENSVFICDLYSERNDSVSIIKKKWGGLNLFITTSFNGSKKKNSAFFTANKKPILPSITLYISDIQTVPLSLLGNTKIIGNALLPRQGIQSGYVNGISFLGDKLIEGNKGVSSGSIPLLNDDIKKLFNLYTSVLFKDIIPLKSLPNSLENSFLKPSIELLSSESIEISNKIIGHVIIYSKTEIIINSKAQLDNVILVAPKIIIQSNFKGRLQAFALSEIIVKKNVQLNYPSYLFCDNIKTSKVYIDSNTEIFGGIYHCNFSGTNNNNSGVVKIIDSKIIGQVVSSGNVLLNGAIYGQLICNKIFWKSLSNDVYENYLSDCVISNLINNNSFLYPLIFEGQKCETILLKQL